MLTPDPVRVRRNSVAALDDLGLPLPGRGFPLVWEDGDAVDLRPAAEVEERIAVLNVVLARTFGMPGPDALGWLESAGLTGRLTPPEQKYVADDDGDPFSFALHLDAVHALTWVLGLTAALDPLSPPAESTTDRLPNLPAGEPFADWRARILSAPRPAAEVAAALDLYYCLDWAYLESERRHLPLPGLIDSNAIGQRRWGLEWAVVFTGPYHEPPVAWDEVDLTV
jgi:uncharacterized protein DUF4272